MGKPQSTGNLINAIAQDSSNNIGIGGAANASFKLQVSGSVNLAGNVTTTGAQFVQNGFYLTNANAGALAGYTNMWGADDGIFFGLRNATGGAKFVFQSATSYNYTFPAATGTLALTSNLSAYLPLTGGTLTGALSGTSATFRTDQNAYTWSRIDNQANNAAAYAGLQLGAYGNTWGIAIGSSLANSNSLNFVIDAGGTNTPRLTIASTGAATFSSSVTANGLAINGGTTSSLICTITSASSFAFGSTNGRRIANIQYNAGDAPGLQFGYDLTDNTGIIAGGTQGAGAGIDFYTFNGSSWGNKMRVNANGIITIPNLAAAGSRAVLADSSGNLSAPVSDISVKQNISTIGYGLNEILKMNPVWFDFIDEYKNYGEGRQNGNIAQEMEEIIPEAVFTTPSTGKMGINYDQLHAVYIKAIQEQQAQIEELKALIAAK